jgi:HD-GYP domain-containing protein (c-di-GMP phosphodiesterase class II)
LAPLAEVVHAHHERWDGTGYPLGLRGESIPLLSRIIAIVDVFEALTSDRPYRCALSAEQAMTYLNEGAGSQFDPGLVPLFEQLYREARLSFAAPAESLAAPPDTDAVPSLRGDAPPALRLLPGLD